ncbi:MAG: Gfo/Idh/MocA family protein [Candidatus Excrementavichristensenella sp.]|jgi:predicted dehydrogenase|nr:Gfo/Idh/MocA family oxidoreductase [Bacillota bacterium]NLL53625.1 Gfo/Idh/MocA family oxidoreductase [Clostridiales bacterium]
MDKVRVAVIGLGFGGEFVPIYQAWDKTECVAVCRRDPDKLRGFADSFGIEKRYTDYKELLQDPDIDAVHINTDLNSHARIAIEALKAGKHVASTVTMGLTREECREIVRLEQETGLVYMMMETAVYTREFLYVKKLYEAGEMGRLQFLRGSHQQNMSLPGWPSYWYGLPPMWYPTHAVSPLSGILRRPVTQVRCIGSGRINQAYAKNYGSPFAAESAHLKFGDSDVTGEITRTLFDTIRQYRESFDFYGTKKSFEWEQCIGEHPVLFSGFEDAVRVEVPDTDHMLPPQIARFALKNQIIDDQHVSFLQGDGHGGSHPHMVLEWISAILEGRKAHISARVAANWTVTGLVAHESAMQGGAILDMPEWALF